MAPQALRAWTIPIERASVLKPHSVGGVQPQRSSGIIGADDLVLRDRQGWFSIFRLARARSARSLAPVVVCIRERNVTDFTRRLTPLRDVNCLSSLNANLVTPSSWCCNKQFDPAHATHCHRTDKPSPALREENYTNNTISSNKYPSFSKYCYCAKRWIIYI